MKKFILILLCLLALDKSAFSSGAIIDTDLFISNGVSILPKYGLALNGSLAIGTSPITGGTSGNCLTTVSGILQSQACFTGLTNNSTTISSGTTGYLLYDNSGVLGELIPSGLTLAWSQITSTPTTLTGYGITSPLPIAQGGTNATTAGAGLNNLLPSQTGNSGKFLGTNGSSTSWIAIGASTPTRPAFFVANSANLTQNSLNIILADNNPSGYLYYLYNISPGTIQKVSKLTNQVIATLVLNSGENLTTGGTIDNTNSFLYVGTGTVTALVAKVNISGTGLTEVGSALSVNHDSGTSDVGAMNIVGTNMYVDAIEYPGTPDIISVVNLSTFTVSSHFNSPAGSRGLYNGLYDGSQYIYYGADTAPSKICKLDTTANTFSTITLTSGESKVSGLATDGTYLYGATNTNTSIIIRVLISTFLEGTPLTTTLDLNITPPVYNPSDGKLYVASLTGSILDRIDVINWTIDNSLTLFGGGGTTTIMALDNNNLYIPNYASPSNEVTIGLSY